MSTFICGLDLGQANDYSALLIVEQLVPQGGTVPAKGPAKPRYDVRHIVRFPLGTSYPTIVDEVAALVQQPPLVGAKLVIDGTGVGRAPVDLFRSRLGRRAIPVTITGGDVVTKGEDGYWHVPKRDLVGAVQVLLQAQRLRFAQGLPLTFLLTQELTGFQVKINAQTAHDSYGAWREGQHDDLVLGLALAVWYAEHDRLERESRRLVIHGTRRYE